MPTARKPWIRCRLFLRRVIPLCPMWLESDSGRRTDPKRAQTGTAGAVVEELSPTAVLFFFRVKATRVEASCNARRARGCTRFDPVVEPWRSLRSNDYRRRRLHGAADRQWHRVE